MPETRPNLRELPNEQRTLALAHWYLFLTAVERPAWSGDCAAILRSLEMAMQPETLHRLALARGSFWQEVTKQTTPHD